LAWDGARVIVCALESNHLYGWLNEQLGLLLGPAGQRALLDSWNRLWYADRPDAPQAETGLWRVRLEDVLHGRPELAAPLAELIHGASVRLGAAQAGRP
jgi:hypothetical protein